MLKSLLHFAWVGSVGLALDALVLAAALGLGISPFAARIVSIAAAGTATWQLNRRFTFGPSGRCLHDEGLRYAAVLATSSLVNYGIFSGLMLAGMGPFAALLVASGAVMVLSFTLYRFIAFAPAVASR